MADVRLGTDKEGTTIETEVNVPRGEYDLIDSSRTGAAPATPTGVTERPDGPPTRIAGKLARIALRLREVEDAGSGSPGRTTGELRWGADDILVGLLADGERQGRRTGTAPTRGIARVDERVTASDAQIAELVRVARRIGVTRSADLAAFVARTCGTAITIDPANPDESVVEALRSMTSDDIGSVIQAIAPITRDAHGVPRDLVEVVGPLLAEEDLWLRQTVTSHSKEGDLTCVTIDFTWIALDTGETLGPDTFIGYGQDAGDGGVSRALAATLDTYFRHTFLIGPDEADQAAGARRVARDVTAPRRRTN